MQHVSADFLPPGISAMR